MEQYFQGGRPQYILRLDVVTSVGPLLTYSSRTLRLPSIHCTQWASPHFRKSALCLELVFVH
eukprot:8252980-Pyramimonas_sp.AAC.1